MAESLSQDTFKYVWFLIKNNFGIFKIKYFYIVFWRIIVLKIAWIQNGKEEKEEN